MDPLRKMYEDFYADNNDPDTYQCFQAGFSKAAVSMRERVMALAQKANTKGQLNDLINKIGSLPDIPEK